MTIPTHTNELPTPALAVDLDAFEANLTAAEELVRSTGTRIRPHVKTHRTPQLALRQLEQPAALGVSCATVGEAETMVEAGIDDVLLANEVVSPAKAERLTALAQRARVSVAVDSLEGVDVLSRAARRMGQTLDVLVDVDVGLGRCGVADTATALDLARSVLRAPGLRFLGLMGYEGRLRASDEGRERRIEAAYAMLADARDRIERDGIDVTVVSSGGTSTMREGASDPTVTEIQAGTYALMEPDLDDLGLPFRPATLVVASVISRASGRVILDAGRKTIACDYGPPVPLESDAATASIHEEHTTLVWDGDPPELDTRILLRPLHVRLTFNLHDAVWLIRGDRVVERLRVIARGRSQ